MDDYTRDIIGTSLAIAFILVGWILAVATQRWEWGLIMFLFAPAYWWGAR